MKKVLYMHTGSANHGCEALVRTTSKLLNGPKDVYLWSFTKEEEEYYGTNNVVEEIYESEQLKKYSISHFEAIVKRKIFKQSNANELVFLRNLFKNNIAISIGGDNYCYPWSAKQAIDLDKEIRKYCKYSVLWGCSIDSEVITKEMKEDLAKFDLITARESITYNNLKKFNPNTVQVADPAFLLEPEYLPLPNEFVENNTVGINVSPLIMEYDTKNITINNYEKLIEFILSETNMNICLIPHVVWDYNNDRIPCKFLYDKFKSSKRISMIEDANCKQLKGYIARCRFLVAARTHASIAAYSSLVPTLVVGYSVKSKGIAIDLFGDYKNYVLPVQSLSKSEDLTNSFKWIIENENTQKNILKNVIPDYKNKAFEGKLALDSLLQK